MKGTTYKKNHLRYQGVSGTEKNMKQMQKYDLSKNSNFTNNLCDFFECLQWNVGHSLHDDYYPYTAEGLSQIESFYLVFSLVTCD